MKDLTRGTPDAKIGVITQIDESTSEVDFERLLASRNIHGVEFDKRRLDDKKYTIKKIYQALVKANSEAKDVPLLWRAMAVRYLEKELKTDFKNTRDMKQKVENYLVDYKLRKIPISQRIAKARKKRKLTQKELAKELGYKSHVPIAQFERGLRYPPDKVIQWIEQAGM